jgi:hypothetical protein
MRTKINDNKVFNIWTCLDCSDDAEVTPDWYQDNGTPVCSFCDRDMEYVRTEIDE